MSKEEHYLMRSVKLKYKCRLEKMYTIKRFKTVIKNDWKMVEINEMMQKRAIAL